MEEEEEPPEVARIKREPGTMADDLGETGRWLETAMAASWQAALPLLQVPVLTDMLGERHRIIANNWQAAQRAALAGTILRRALEVAGRVDFSPPAVRADLAGPRAHPEYLYAAVELIDHAPDIVSDSASLTHDNDRRWRVFRERVQQVTGVGLERAGGQDSAREVRSSIAFPPTPAQRRVLHSR